jgi:hypothetical protein
MHGAAAASGRARTAAVTRKSKTALRGPPHVPATNLAARAVTGRAARRRAVCKFKQNRSL